MTASHLGILGRLVALAIPLGVFVSLAACKVEDGPTGLLIRQDQFLATGEQCTVPASATGVQRTEGTLDVTIPAALDNGYFLYPLVENELGSLMGVAKVSGSPVEEKNNIVLKSFHVSLSVAGNDSFAWPDTCPGTFDFPVVTQVISPGGSASAFVKLIRPCNAAALLARLDAKAPPFIINAKVSAKGHLGSATIESPPFHFDVTVCYGCLQGGYSLAPAAAFEFPNIARCSDLTTNPYLGDPCNPAQDQRILCCTSDDGSSIQCPGVPTGQASP